MLPFLQINSQSKNPEFRLLNLILFSYLFICFPLAQIYFKDSFFLNSYWTLFFFALTLTVLSFSGRLSFSQLGLSSPNSRNISFGLVIGIFPVVVVVVLDLLLLKTGLANNDLFFRSRVQRVTELIYYKFITGWGYKSGSESDIYNGLCVEYPCKKK